MTIRRRGLPRKIGDGAGFRVRPMETVTKSLRDDDGIDHEVAFRSRLFDGRYHYVLRCDLRLGAIRRRWKEHPPTCLGCIAAREGEESDA